MVIRWTYSAAFLVHVEDGIPAHTDKQIHHRVYRWPCSRDESMFVVHWEACSVELGNTFPHVRCQMILVSGKNSIDKHLYQTEHSIQGNQSFTKALTKFVTIHRSSPNLSMKKMYLSKRWSHVVKIDPAIFILFLCFLYYLLIFFHLHSHVIINLFWLILLPFYLGDFLKFIHSFIQNSSNFEVTVNILPIVWSVFPHQCWLSVPQCTSGVFQIYTGI